MSKINMFCITLNPNHLSIIKKLDYIPVGLGDSNFDSSFISDKDKFEIFKKNPYYGEYTFHYRLWKNDFLVTKDWIGFCQYRKFWLKKEIEKKDLVNINDFKKFNNFLLKEIPVEFENIEVILTDEFYVNKFKLSKFIKHGFKKIIKNPELLFNKEKRTIKFHFDMWHGDGNLDKAIDKLPIKEREDFRYFVNKEVSFNSQNMFICKEKKLLFSYYESLFPWLMDCEKIFGFKNLKTYGLQRIYGFLAERYCSYWFKKYSKFKTLPFLFKDISDYL